MNIRFRDLLNRDFSVVSFLTRIISSRAMSVDELPLAVAFKRGLDVLTRMQVGDANAVAIEAGTHAMRHAVTRVDVEGVFSANESRDEFPTENLRYLMAPWYLAELCQRAATTDPMSRLKSLTETSAMYDMFLNQCSEYEMLSDSAKRALPNRGDQIDPATARQEKVERFKRTKEIRTRLEVLDKGRVERLRTALAEADWDDEDPENTNSISPENEKDERERWMLLLEDAVVKTMDSRSAIAIEVSLLERRVNDESASGSHGKTDRDQNSRRAQPPSSSGMGNYVIQPGGGIEQIGRGYVPGGNGTRQSQVEISPVQLGQIQRAMQNLTGPSDRSKIAHQVFRPSHILPTMSVEEFGEIEYAELMERTAREQKNKLNKELEESALTEEEKEERELEKKRAWDEFKDDNPFGHGNSKLRPCS